MWRTFCVNYEAGSKDDPPEEKAKRRLKVFKLKHSRLLTCYSALLYLLSVFQAKGTVSRDDALHMISLTPTCRLEWLKEQPDLTAERGLIDELMERYEWFLQCTDLEKPELLRLFQDKQKSKGYLEPASLFGEKLFHLLAAVGKNSSFHRLLVV
jgi:hypothetical protein